jgi:hypothetical protein
VVGGVFDADVDQVYRDEDGGGRGDGRRQPRRTVAGAAGEDGDPRRSVGLSNTRLGRSRGRSSDQRGQCRAVIPGVLHDRAHQRKDGAAQPRATSRRVTAPEHQYSP